MSRFTRYANTNIYRKARQSAEIALKDAAFKLSMSDGRLRKMETEALIPDPEEVAVMTTIYMAPWLSRAHVKQIAERVQKKQNALGFVAESQGAYQII